MRETECFTPCLKYFCYCKDALKKWVKDAQSFRDMGSWEMYHGPFFVPTSLSPIFF